MVRNAYLGLDAADLSTAVRKVRSIASAAAGLVATENQSGEDGASLTLRVPADRLESVIEQVSALGTVTSRRSQTTDVTEQVVDLDARVASQQASVDRIRALLARAESIGDIASIESQLAQREGELNSLKNRLAALNGKVALSTLNVDIDGPGALPPPAADTPGFLAGIAAGWQTLVRIAIVAGAVIGFLDPVPARDRRGGGDRVGGAPHRARGATRWPARGRGRAARDPRGIRSPGPPRRRAARGPARYHAFGGDGWCRARTARGRRPYQVSGRTTHGVDTIAVTGRRDNPFGLPRPGVLRTFDR